jgi:hypothetical protein
MVRIFCLLNLSWSLRWLPEPPRPISMISCGCVQGRLPFTHPSFFLNDFLRIALLEVQFRLIFCCCWIFFISTVKIFCNFFTVSDQRLFLKMSDVEGSSAGSPRYFICQTWASFIIEGLHEKMHLITAFCDSSFWCQCSRSRTFFTYEGS